MATPGWNILVKVNSFDVVDYAFLIQVVYIFRYIHTHRHTQTHTHTHTHTHIFRYMPTYTYTHTCTHTHTHTHIYIVCLCLRLRLLILIQRYYYYYYYYYYCYYYCYYYSQITVKSRRNNQTVTRLQRQRDTSRHSSRKPQQAISRIWRVTDKRMDNTATVGGHNESAYCADNLITMERSEADGISNVDISGCLSF